MKASEFVEPGYMAKLRAHSDEFAKLTPVQIELRLAAMPGVEQFTGLSQHEHRKRAMAWCFPSRVDHPWRERLLTAFHHCKANRIQELMLLGSSNSTKTSTLADVIVEVWLECPEATTIYITSPYEDATETGLWARVVEQFDEMKLHNPELPGRHKPSHNMIVQYDNNPLSFIKVVSIDKVGKLVGKKSKSMQIGFMLIVADELPEFPQQGRALVSVMNNLISVRNMMLIGAGNFALTSDALGVFSEPDMPGGYSALRVHEHYEWKSTRGGMVIRFDGDQSPALEDPDRFFFLPDARYRDQLAKQSGGVRSADYYRYWHSFPLVGSEEFTVTNPTKLKTSGAYDEHYTWTGDRVLKGGHVDAGFGGDVAILQPWRLGYIWRQKEMAGRWINTDEKIQVFEAWGPPQIIPIDVESDLTAEEQIVDFHRNWAAQNGVPAEHCSFDGSLRASIVQEYGRRWSNRVVAIDSGGSATDRKYSTIKEWNSKTKEETKRTVKWCDKFSNLVTEQWFAVAEALISRQIRGLSSAPNDPTCRQLCSRQWKPAAKHKKQVETKKDYKDRNSKKSPNEADALCGGVEMARRLGFVIDIENRETPDTDAVLKRLAKELHSQNLAMIGQRAPLPPGKLHATARSTPSRHGRLHR